MALHGDRKTEVPTRSPAGPPSKRERPTTRSSSQPGCGSISPHACTTRPSPLLRAFLQHVDIAISVHGFGRDSFALWIDPERGLVIEPYGPAIRGNQSGPLRGVIVGGRNAELLKVAGSCCTTARGLSRGRRAGATRIPSRQPGQPALGARHPVELPPGCVASATTASTLPLVRTDNHRGGRCASWNWRTGPSKSSAHRSVKTLVRLGNRSRPKLPKSASTLRRAHLSQ